MSEMAPRESIVHQYDLDENRLKREEFVVLIGSQKKKEKVKKKNQKKIYEKSLEEMWENEQFIQIKGIQKTQEAVNRNLRQLHLDKMKISRNKRIEEVTENIRRRRETQQQKNVLKEVLKNLKDNEKFHDERNLNSIHKGETDKEKLIKNGNTQRTLGDKSTHSLSRLHYRDDNSKDILPPLVRATRRKPYLPMSSVKNSAISTSSFGEMITSKYEDGNVTIATKTGTNRRSLVITIPDINTDASFHSQRVSRAQSRSATSISKSSVKSDGEKIKTQTKEKPVDDTKLNEVRPSSTKTKLKDLPPIKFTLKGLNGTPVSYLVDKDKMISYRPSCGIPFSKIQEEKPLNPPAMMVSPRNSSVSIPLVRKDPVRTKENLSIVGKNLQLPSEEIAESYPTQHSLGRVSSYDIRASVSPVSSRSGSYTSKNTMRGSKLSKRRVSKESAKKQAEYTSNTGFVISEFAMQERAPKKQYVQMEKQPLHEFPVHVRERFIKKKLLMAENDKQDALSWKVRKYITDPGTFSSVVSRDLSSPVEVRSDNGYKRTANDYASSMPPNKKDISDLLLRMLLKQSPRNKIQRERTVPSEEKILKTSIENKTIEPKES